MGFLSVCIVSMTVVVMTFVAVSVMVMAMFVNLMCFVIVIVAGSAVVSAAGQNSQAGYHNIIWYMFHLWSLY